MKLVRFYVPGKGARLGQWIDGTVYDLTASALPPLSTIGALLDASTQTAIGTLLAESIEKVGKDLRGRMDWLSE